MTLAANKRLGQNFLVNKGIIEKIIAAAALTPNDTILEIGPGLGAITIPLAARAKKIIAVEKDKRLVELLKEKLALENITNVEIITGDILRFLSSSDSSPTSHTRFDRPERLTIEGLSATSYSVVANIPYYLTSALIRALLERAEKPERMLLMIQKEVAQRICARDGKESILSLAVKFYATPSILFFVSRGSFSPAPKVDSAIIEIVPHKKPSSIPAEMFFTVVKAGFSAPRKKLLGNLASKLNKKREDIALMLEKTGISPDARAETVSIDQWTALTHHLLRLNLHIFLVK